MLVEIFRWAAFLLSLSIIVVYFKGGSIIVKDAKRSVETTGKSHYLRFTVIMGIMGLIILIAQLLICLNVISPDPYFEQDWILILGSALVIAGLSTSYWIRYQYLRGYWSGTVEIKNNHQIINIGPYRIVRHPIYTTTLFTYTGAALAYAVWWNWIACGMMILGYFWLTEYEDQYLTANLQGYEDYKLKTKRKLIPGIW